MNHSLPPPASPPADCQTVNDGVLHTVVETLPLRVFWKDRECRYLGCNTAFARDAGFNDPAELIGKDDFAMAWHDQAERFPAHGGRTRLGSGSGVG